MTKDLALLVGADQRWLSTTGFLDKVAGEPRRRRWRRKPPPSHSAKAIESVIARQRDDLLLAARWIARAAGRDLRGPLACR